MSINHKVIIGGTLDRCAVCGGRELELLVDLPGLPLTDTFCQEIMLAAIRGIDQQLQFCRVCGHAQLGRQVNPNILYGEGYGFRTSTSITARKGTEFFLSFLDELAPGRQFSCILDLGCNDLYLLEQLQGRARIRCGIDPIWASREGQVKDQSLRVIGAPIEEVDLGLRLEARPDLILCRHTLEHIADPVTVLHRLFDFAAADALFLFEVPGLEALVNRFRFDQVFHQHLQYFSPASFHRLIRETGGYYLSHRINYHDWGALLIAFTKKNGNMKKWKESFAKLELSIIKRNYNLFLEQMANMNHVLMTLNGSLIYGYGAAQMLPVLAYHLKNDFSSFKAIIDDDPSKDGWYYSNLPVPIQHADKADALMESSIFITAIDNVSSILVKLLKQRPRHILYPFNLI
jgi:hypothetical protein